MGYIDAAMLETLAVPMKNNGYGKYLFPVAQGQNPSPAGRSNDPSEACADPSGVSGLEAFFFPACSGDGLLQIFSSIRIS